jgi:hypothetical protein
MSSVNDTPFDPQGAFFPDGINPTPSDTVLLTSKGFLQANATGYVGYVSGKTLTTAIWLVPYAGAFLRTRVAGVLSGTTTVPSTAIQLYVN